MHTLFVEAEGPEAPTDVWAAANANDLSALRQLLEDGGNSVDEINASGVTPLHLCASLGHAKMAQYLISKGANIHKCDAESGWTPLHRALYNKRIGLALMLIEHGAKPMMPDAAGYTALHSAAASGRLDTTQKFLQTCDAKAVNTADLDGLTPLHVASAGGYEDVVRLLLDSGADVHLRCKMGRTAQDWAEEEFEDEVKAILERHAATAAPPVEAAEAAGSDAVAGGSSSSSVVGRVEEAQQADVL